MLVYYYIDKGMAWIAGKRIYGISLGYEPTVVSWQDYKNNKNALVQGFYTPEYLSKYFGPCPLDVRFAFNDVHLLDFRELQKLGTYIKISSLGNKRELIWRIRHALKDI